MISASASAIPSCARVTWIVLAGLTFLFLPTLPTGTRPASAQSFLHVGAGSGDLTGGDFVEAERGLVISARWMEVRGWFQGGLGFDYMRVSIDADGPLTQYDALLHYRYLFGTEGVRPFAGAVAGLTSQNFRDGGRTHSARGATLGLNGGLEVPLASRWVVDVAIDVRSVWMGAFSANGREDPSSEASGFRIAALASIVVPL